MLSIFVNGFVHLLITTGVRLHKSCQSSFLHHGLSMGGQVASKVVSLHEAFSTVPTHMLLVVRVLHPHVLLHVRILSESHSTPGAHVRFVTTVQQLVADKIVLELELLSTHITFKVPLGLMGQLVPVKSCSLSESFSTVITLMRFLPTRIGNGQNR